MEENKPMFTLPTSEPYTPDAGPSSQGAQRTRAPKSICSRPRELTP
jgi:hypothetical protein